MSSVPSARASPLSAARASPPSSARAEPPSAASASPLSAARAEPLHVRDVLDLIQRQSDDIVAQDEQLRGLQRENSIVASPADAPLLTPPPAVMAAAVDAATPPGHQPPRSDQPPQDILTTTECYVTSQGEDFASRERADLQEIVSRGAVPGWRVVHVPPAYSMMEGAEDIEDETLLERHEKLCQDEIRRKRLHVQQVRQQRQMERLRARSDDIGAAEDGGGRVRSLLPDPTTDATHICVTEWLPVSAFGAPLPALPSKPFRLPWLKDDDDEPET